MNKDSEIPEKLAHKLKRFVVVESVGCLGLISLFAGSWIQFGFGWACIVNGVLFVSTAVVSAFRG